MMPETVCLFEGQTVFFIVAHIYTKSTFLNHFKPLKTISNNIQTMTQPSSRHLPARKRIALVAHDNKKKDLIDWAYYNRTVLARHELLATGTTGRLLTEALDRPVKCLHSGPLGGDLEIGALIAEGKIDVLIFFWDPMEAQPHDPDIKALLRIGVVWNILIACDRSTADFLLTSPLMQDEYEAKLPDYSEYTGRKMR
ncbi:MAG: Methylglyoxal synthase [Saprospiraceae bacterium]|nr:Methylglyoxal synthase [Saprospiraceae bacterium]